MQAPFNSFEEAMSVQFPQESEGSKSGQSSPVYQDEENPESDDPQFPGVTDIHPKAGERRLHYEDDEEEEDGEKEMDEESIGEEEEEEEEDEMNESEMEEEEEVEVPPEDDENELILTKAVENITTLKQPLLCRSIRIGSFKIHPKNSEFGLKVYLAMDGLSFNAYMVTDASKIVNITLKPCDVTRLFVHFGKCLPLLFIFTTPSFGQSVRKSLNMVGLECSFFDPSSADERLKMLTFLIDTINKEQRRFLLYTFLNERLHHVRELDQETANKILVKSTPNQFSASAKLFRVKENDKEKTKRN